MFDVLKKGSGRFLQGCELATGNRANGDKKRCLVSTVSYPARFPTHKSFRKANYSGVVDTTKVENDAQQLVCLSPRQRYNGSTNLEVSCL